MRMESFWRWLGVALGKHWKVVAAVVVADHRRVRDRCSQHRVRHGTGQLPEPRFADRDRQRRVPGRLRWRDGDPALQRRTTAPTSASCTRRQPTPNSNGSRPNSKHRSRVHSPWSRRSRRCSTARISSPVASVPLRCCRRQRATRRAPKLEMRTSRWRPGPAECDPREARRSDRRAPQPLVRRAADLRQHRVRDRRRGAVAPARAGTGGSPRWRGRSPTSMADRSTARQSAVSC
jgi:hypothetical protein